MTLKEECEYFETDISPFEQYNQMLEQEKYQLLSEREKRFDRYQPNCFYVKSGQRCRLV